MHKLLLIPVLFALVACQASTEQSSQPTPAPSSTQMIQSEPTRQATPEPAPTAPVLSPFIDRPPILEDTVDSQTGTAYGLAFSPDGSTLAIATGVGLTVVDANFKKPGAVVLPPNVGFLSVSWNPGGDQLASVAGLRNPNFYLWSWNPGQGQIQKGQQYNSGADLYAVSWSPDGNTLITLSEEPTPKIHVWEAATWEKTSEIDLPARQSYRVLDWSPDSKSVFEAWEVEGELVLWRIEVDPPAYMEVMRLPAGEITYLSVSPDARLVAVADNEGEIRILSIPDGNVIGTIQAAPEPVDIDWHPQGNQLAVLSYRTTLQIWDLGGAQMQEP